MIWPEMVVREARRRLEAATWPQMVEGCFQIARNSTKPKKIQKKTKKNTKKNPSSIHPTLKLRPLTKSVRASGSEIPSPEYASEKLRHDHHLRPDPDAGEGLSLASARS